MRTRGALVLVALTLVGVAACSSAQAADRVGSVAVAPDLPASPTLTAEATARAEELCAAGDTGIRTDPAAYRAETWAEVAEIPGRARMADDDVDAALTQIRAGWAGADELAREDWDRAGLGTAVCSDGTLAAVQALARTATSADAGTYRRARIPAEAIQHREAVRYATATDVAGEEVDLLLDLFIPPESAAAGERPALVIVHGGGFTAGSRTQHTDDAIGYARRGFVVATIDYRVDPDAGASERAHRAAAFAAIDDAMEAIRWLKVHAADIAVDPDRIAALGASAGGAIVLGLALLDDLTPGGPYAHVSPRVAAAFSTGSYLTPVRGVASLEPTDAPVLLHHYETDSESGRPWTHAGATCDALRTAGGTCDLDITPGGGHVVGLGTDSTEIGRILAFLAVHLRLDG